MRVQGMVVAAVAVVMVAGCGNQSIAGRPSAGQGTAGSPVTTQQEPVGVRAKALSTAFPIEGRDLRLVRSGNGEIALQLELFNGTGGKWAPYWNFGAYDQLHLVDVRGGATYDLLAKPRSLDWRVSANGKDEWASGSSQTVTAVFTAPPESSTEMLTHVPGLAPVLLPIQPQGSAALVDDPVLHAPASSTLGVRANICAAKGPSEPGKAAAPIDIRLPSDVLFAFGSAELSPAAEAAIAEVKEQVKATAGQIAVEGHTDAIGDDASNQQLSDRRAAAVRDAVAKVLGNGFTYQVQGHGEAKPVAPNQNPDGSDNPSGRAANRRVEIRFTTPGQATPAALDPPKFKTGLAAAGLKATLGPVTRIGGNLLVTLEVTNPTSGPVSLAMVDNRDSGLMWGGKGGPSGLVLVDRTNQRRIALCHAARTGDRIELASPGGYYLPGKYDSLPAGATATIWGLYQSPPTDVRSVDVELDGFGTTTPLALPA